MSLIELIAHLDEHLLALSRDYGAWAYFIMSAIIFGETGLVIAPFLPGDTLLFVAGAVAANGVLDLWVLLAVLILAAFLGNLLNYRIGLWLGPRVFQASESRFFRRDYLDRAHRFYERHGGKTIVLARFLPIIRTYAPFVAGVGGMSLARFAIWNLVGAILWVGSLTTAGYFFGNVPAIKGNLSVVVVFIVLISVLPALVGLLRGRAAE